MSLSKAIIKAIDSGVVTFIERIIKTYNLPSSDKSKLLKLWDAQKESNQKESNSLTKKTKAQLVELCKKYNLKITGKKSVLIERLNKRNKLGKLVQKSGNMVPVIQIRKNSFGNYEHLDTGFVFSKVEQKVIGVQNKDGTIRSLVSEDLELCNKFKFAYQMPELLEVNTDEIIEELEKDALSEKYFSD